MEKTMIEPRAKVSHFINQGFELTGIIHIGANDGEEVPSYKEMGIKNVMCIEPIPEKCAEIRERYPYVHVINCAAGGFNHNDILFTTSGDGMQGSSFYEGRKKDFYWPAPVSDKIMVKVMRMDTVLKNINIEDYNCIVIDVQGYEGEVLIGFGNIVPMFPFWSIECSADPIYIGGWPAREVVSFMDKNGFIQDSPIEPHNDVFFIDKKIKPVSDMIYRGGLLEA